MVAAAALTLAVRLPFLVVSCAPHVKVSDNSIPLRFAFASVVVL